MTQSERSKADTKVSTFYADGSNPTRAENPFAQGWHYKLGVYSVGMGWSYRPSEEAYPTEDATMQAGRRAASQVQS